MKTIVLAAPKGGVGKTTLALSLACHVATLRQQQVALLDFDHSQGSLASWWRRRGSPENPILGSQFHGFADAKEKLFNVGIDWLFTDTSPSDYEVIEECVMLADFVVVPLQPAFIDVESTLDLMELLQAKAIPYGFVVNRAEPRERLTKTTEQSLIDAGHRSLGTITDRSAFRVAHTKGETAMEIERDGKAAQEISDLWKSVTAVLNAKVRKVSHG